jgi:di/tricarboxylate transporter
VSLAWISLAALIAAVVAGIALRVNIGLLALALAYLVGAGLGGMPVREVTAGFPVSLFLVLVAIMFLFAQAQVNGTLPKVARQSIRLARGNLGMVPIVFFGLSVAIATLGGGNIAATALIAPIAMAAAGRMGISAFLMTIMVGNGCNAGAFSPIAPTGIVANQLMAEAGLAGMEWQTFWNTFFAQSFVAFSGYFLLGGVALLRSEKRVDAAEHLSAEDLAPFNRAQWFTLAVLAALLVTIILFGVDIIVGAYVCAAILLLTRVADQEAAIKAVPWGTIMLVCGVSTLVSVLGQTGGMDVIVDMLVAMSTATSVTGIVAFVSGLISAYSSTVGVVLPAFLPLVPGLAERLGADPMAIASSINVGGHLVDVSPLSTIGAICLAAAAPHEDRHALFNKVLAWGLSMSVVGALVCWVFFGLL